MTDNMVSPIEYRKILVQFAFLVHADGRLQIKMLSQLPAEKKFKNTKEARQFIRELKEII